MARKKTEKDTDKELKQEVNSFVDNLLDDKIPTEKVKPIKAKNIEPQPEPEIEKVDLIYFEEPTQRSLNYFEHKFKNLGNIYVLDNVIEIWTIPNLSTLFIIANSDTHTDNEDPKSLAEYINNNIELRFSKSGIKLHKTLKALQELYRYDFGHEVLNFENDYVVVIKELFEEINPSDEYYVKTYYNNLALKKPTQYN